ncbi:MAG: DUF6851 domain-containing protein [Pseudomonadota bacterium]
MGTNDNGAGRGQGRDGGGRNNRDGEKSNRNSEFEIDGNVADFDIAADGKTITLTEWVTGEETVVRRVGELVFNDASFDAKTLRQTTNVDNDDPSFLIGGGTQVLTVNDTEPTISVLWDRAVQQAVIDTQSDVGPTIASRAYALVHTAIYDAWASFDETAVRVSLDLEGDNEELFASATDTDANQAKAMSYAAHRVLSELFPDQQPLFDTLMQTRLGHDIEDDGSIEAAIGVDAAEDLMALRREDGSNQESGYADTTGYEPVNPNPFEINDITRWTPESVPIDPEDGSPEQSFLTPHWLEVESFALGETADGETDFDAIRPAPPQPFFTNGFEGSTLNFDARTITLSQAIEIGGILYAAGEDIPVSKDLIGSVINPEFITQAEEIVQHNADLTDNERLIGEFWEDGAGTSFPPGTFMTFAQYVSARDNNSLDEDAQLFLAMGNAQLDAGIATWEAKVHYDYARPVRLIRDLGELGLIGDPVVDEETGEEVFMIEAWAGTDPDTGENLGVQLIPATEFISYQRPSGEPSPPFAEYTSGHSAFSAAGAEVLALFTGSQEFGAGVSFAPGSGQFTENLPVEEEFLFWDTFEAAADESGVSRLYGGIHYTEGNVNGLALGEEVGAEAYALAQSFIDGTATDEDRPFFADAVLV